MFIEEHDCAGCGEVCDCGAIDSSVCDHCSYCMEGEDED